MSTSHDKVTLSAEERRLLAQLEHRAGGDDPGLRSSLTLMSRVARRGSRRARDAATVLLLVFGALLMTATFTRWPVVAVVGVIIQGFALWVGLPRCAPPLGSLVRSAWAEIVRSSGVRPPQ